MEEIYIAKYITHMHLLYKHTYMIHIYPHMYIYRKIQIDSHAAWKDRREKKEKKMR